MKGGPSEWQRRGDGLILRGKTWWLDFTHMGERHQSRLGKNVSRTVARELAAVERAKILKGEAGIGGKGRKDISFDKAVEEFIKWAGGEGQTLANIGVRSDWQVDFIRLIVTHAQLGPGHSVDL